MSGHMRLPPHVSFQGRDRPGHSALRFSPAGLSGEGCYSALSLLAASGLEADAMPFRKLGQAALTRRLDVRVSPAEKVEMLSIAEAAGLSVSELVRRRVLGAARRCAHRRHHNPRAPPAGWLAQEGARRQRWRV